MSISKFVNRFDNSSWASMLMCSKLLSEMSKYSMGEWAVATASIMEGSDKALLERSIYRREGLLDKAFEMDFPQSRRSPSLTVSNPLPDKPIVFNVLFRDTPKSNKAVLIPIPSEFLSRIKCSSDEF